MNFKTVNVTVKQLVADYYDGGEEGISGYSGNLDIRPPYQRNFVYKDKQREEVIRSVLKGYPLNTMYWADNGSGKFEILDGQQRTISLCQYCAGEFSVDFKYFQNLTEEEQKTILDYTLTVNVCKGSAADKLAWFKTINIAGEVLTSQELRNATYTGPWLSSAKSYFSKSNGGAYTLASDYLKGSAIRQDYLETALRWISNKDIEEYMGKHQQDKDAKALTDYFEKVIKWVKKVFPTYSKPMKGIEWGLLYNQYKSQTKSLQTEVDKLMADEEVQRKSGIFEYLLSGKDPLNQRLLSLRTFSDSDKQTAFAKQKGLCPITKKTYKFDEMEADHIKAWSKGGKTTLKNLQMIFKDANRQKGAN